MAIILAHTLRIYAHPKEQLELVERNVNIGHFPKLITSTVYRRSEEELELEKRHCDEMLTLVVKYPHKSMSGGVGA